MTTTPPPDREELRVRAVLRRTIDGNPTAPAAPSADWWEKLYDEAQTDHAGGAVPKRRRIPSIKRPAVAKPEVEAEPDEAADPEWEDAEPEDESTPRAVKRGKRQQEIRAAYQGLDRRTRWLLSIVPAAATGWFLGLEPAMGGWIRQCQGDTGHVGTALIVGLGLLGVGAYASYRTRGWWPPLAWCCRIPLASALLALALYAPGVTP